MAVDNHFQISYNGISVGGASDVYLLHEPYVIDRSFTELRLAFTVVVVGTSYANLQASADTLENAYADRDGSISIDLDAIDNPGTSVWTFTNGTGLLNSQGSVTKTGNPKTDRGYSRAYTVTVGGELPANDQSGLLELTTNVRYSPSRQRIVTFEGTYKQGGSVAAYESDFDGEATTFLNALSGTRPYELADEHYTRDRNDHTCHFFRQYVELLANQKSGETDNDIIKDHDIQFTELVPSPGDALEDIYRLRKVVGTYDAGVDVDEVTLSNPGELKSAVVEAIVQPLILEMFSDTFQPTQFAIEDMRISYNETSARVSASFTLTYVHSSAGDIVEVSISQAFEETRTPRYTPLHRADEFAYFVDPGWATRLRMTSRTVMVLGDQMPIKRIGEHDKNGLAGPMTGADGKDMQFERNVVSDGWNVIGNTSRVTPVFIGAAPGDATGDAEQIRVTVLDETVVERFHRKGGGTTRGVVNTG